jgi:pimeloyl-ACP methyl ester carboxylesterase
MAHARVGPAGLDIARVPDRHLESARHAIGAALAAPHELRSCDARHFHQRVEGVLLHWVEFGSFAETSVGKPPTVLLHGLNDSSLTWRQIAPGLARDRRVIVLDLPGHGTSDRPNAGYELAWYAKIVAAWIEVLALTADEPVDIVGHSLGGGIALMLLQVCRPRIRRLVLAAPGGLGREITFMLRLASIAGVVEHFGQPFMALGTRLALRQWRDRLPSGHIAELSALNSRRGSARAFSRTVRGLVSWSGQRHSFCRHAYEIAGLPPIAILWGDRDSVLPIAHGRALAQGIEGVKLTELTGCGHYLHHDDPESFLQGVRDALDAIFWPAVRLTAAASASWRAPGASLTRPALIETGHSHDAVPA